MNPMPPRDATAASADPLPRTSANTDTPSHNVECVTLPQMAITLDQIRHLQRGYTVLRSALVGLMGTDDPQVLRAMAQSAADVRPEGWQAQVSAAAALAVFRSLVEFVPDPDEVIAMAKASRSNNVTRG